MKSKGKHGSVGRVISRCGERSQKAGTTLEGLQKLHKAGCFTELRGKSKIEAMPTR